MQTQKYVIGNWKLNPQTLEQATLLIDQINQSVTDTACVVGCAPSFVHFLSVKTRAKQGVWVGVQDVAHKTQATGAFTGDVSAAQLADLQADFVIIGHSERRQYHGENNDVLRQKIQHALAENLTVVFCIGETKEQYDDKQTLSVLDEQLSILQAFGGAKIITAYEPVWAIGTGLTPTLAEIEQTHQHIKAILTKYDLPTTVLYGGSVNADNAGEFGTSAWIDGALVGGASLKADSFAQIIRAFG